MELSARQSSLRPSVGLPSLEEALGRDHHRHNNNNNNNNSSHLAQQQQQQQPPRSLGHISSLSLPGLISDNSHLHGLHHSPGTSPDSTLQDEGHPHLSPPRGNNQRLDLDPGLIPHCLASSTGSGNNSSFYIQNSMNTPSSVGNAMALVGASQSGGMHGDGGLGLGSHGAPQSPMYNPAMWASNMADFAIKLFAMQPMSYLHSALITFHVGLVASRYN
ncbi:hypothetical protein CAPTEDRAFT_202584 [Capitella teleta]|uniref:Uncharacterized protein n=1 Tax=Capitella teleta TaxID=283909 RepID=R7V3V0_CAPTE|nr:hypothetical protein CAPTEDRAFT_202584 [Capitella teleta]|eukprot:ELU13142.1 hypothetical protein CAPTEDRAFT_202584 [Capitella teleta]